MEAFQKELEELKKELEEQKNATTGKSKLQQDYDALSMIYEGEHEVNLIVERALPDMYANIFRKKGSISWMNNYHEALMIVYDLVVAREKQLLTKEGREFDEGIFSVQEFTPEERSIIYT